MFKWLCLIIDCCMGVGMISFFCPARRGWSHLRAMAPWNQPRLPHSTVPEVGQHVPGLQGQPRPRNPRRHLQRCVDTSLLKHPC